MPVNGGRSAANSASLGAASAGAVSGAAGAAGRGTQPPAAPAPPPLQQPRPPGLADLHAAPPGIERPAAFRVEQHERMETAQGDGAQAFDDDQQRAPHLSEAR